jgi:hypothetical protein
VSSRGRQTLLRAGSFANPAMSSEAPRQTDELAATRAASFCLSPLVRVLRHAPRPEVQALDPLCAWLWESRAHRAPHSGPGRAERGKTGAPTAHACAAGWK